jgi:hypothetical protein
MTMVNESHRMMIPEEYSMNDDNIPDGSYDDIDVSLHEEVNRRISTARARQQHERNRLMKHADRNPAINEKLERLNDITEKRIQGILNWAREQSACL